MGKRPKEEMGRPPKPLMLLILVGIRIIRLPRNQAKLSHPARKLHFSWSHHFL